MSHPGFLQTIPSSEDTSAFPLWFNFGTFTETSTETEPVDQLYRKVSERISLSGLNLKGLTCKRLPSEESAYPYKFQSTISITASNVNLLYQSFKNYGIVIIHHEGKIETQELHSWGDFYTEGPPDDAWTVASWVLDAPSECALIDIDDITEIKSDLKGLLSNFKQALPLERPSDLISLAEKAASQIEQRKDEDVETWAENLSKDLSKLSD
jgi:hypothetical protein